MRSLNHGLCIEQVRAALAKLLLEELIHVCEADVRYVRWFYRMIATEGLPLAGGEIVVLNHAKVSAPLVIEPSMGPLCGLYRFQYHNFMSVSR